MEYLQVVDESAEKYVWAHAHLGAHSADRAHAKALGGQARHARKLDEERKQAGDEERTASLAGSGTTGTTVNGEAHLLDTTGVTTAEAVRRLLLATAKLHVDAARGRRRRADG